MCVRPKVLPVLAQCSIQSRIRRSSGPINQPKYFDLRGTRVGWPIFLSECVWGFQSRENRYRKATTRVFLAHRVGIELLPKACLPTHIPLPLLGANARPKSKKPNAKPFSKAAQRKQQLRNQKPLTKYIIEGKEVWRPYYEFGYSRNGKNPDQNSSRPKNKAKGKGGKGQKGKGKGDGTGLKGGNWENSEAPPNAVRGFSPKQSLDSKICGLEGTNLRQLRDGLGLCSPAIIQPGKRQRKTFWNAISKVLLEVCGRNILTSEVIRPPKPVEGVTRKFLDKGCRN